MNQIELELNRRSWDYTRSLEKAQVSFGQCYFAEYGAITTGMKTLDAPEYENRFQPIPGRNGDFVQGQKRFKNKEIEYSFAIINLFSENFRKLKNRLLSMPGYQDLRCTDDRMSFRKAVVKSCKEVKRGQKVDYGTFTVTFICMPQRFLTSGESAVIYDARGELVNTTLFAAKPLITIHGTGPGTLTVAGVPCEIKALTDYITLDCERMTAKRGAEYRDGDVYIPKYPVLPAGSSEISWDGGITSVEIVPRWWTV